MTRVPRSVRFAAPTLAFVVISMASCARDRPSTTVHEAPAPPATLTALDEADASTIRVAIGGEMIVFELAMDSAARARGLQGRPALDQGRGLLFVYPDERVRYFWMPGCPVPIDVIFLDESGRVLNATTMQAEPPRGQSESIYRYEARLPRYPSDGPAPFVVELRAGEIDRLDVRPGDVIDFDHAALFARARW